MEVWLVCLGLFLRLLNVLLKPIVAFIGGPKRNTPFPEIRNDMLNIPAVDLAERIRNKELRSEDVVRAYIDRIREVNPLINAVVEERFSAAIEEARKADVLIGETQPLWLIKNYPLLGVPFTVKESCALRGAPITGGSLARKGVRATVDGEAVAHLRAAGCIPLLVSNTPEYCLNWESYNHLTGRTLNPYDNRRTAGGSSGGEGALIGAGASLFGVGSDVAGSIRVPAHFNGIFGHKPTAGAISIHGHFPMSTDEKFGRLLTVGPMARYAKDLPTLLHIMAGPNASRLRLDESVHTKDIRILYAEDMGFNLGHVPVDDDIKMAMYRAVQYFKGHGLVTERAEFDHMVEGMELAFSVLQSITDVPSIFHNPDNPKASPNLLVELAKCAVGQSQYSLAGIMFYVIFGLKNFFTAERLELYQEQAAALRKQMTDTLGTDGVFFFPTYPTAALRHYESFGHIMGVGYTMLFNSLGLPATHVPLGFDRNGLPIGIQVVAAPYQDRLGLCIARELEAAFGGWRAPNFTECICAHLSLAVAMELLLKVVALILRVVNLVLEPILAWFGGPPRTEPFPVIRDDLLRIPATELADRIRQGTVRSVDVVRAYVLRIRDVNPLINAVVEERFEAALGDATEADERVAACAGDVQALQELARSCPLLGVPITVKESCSVKGLSLSGGVVRRQNLTAEEDGEAVGLLRKAGAIPLLVSNTPEYCMAFESYNNVSGRTLNPYDPKRTPAGSSGGEGALIGAGASVCGVGSDLAGSIRIPALFCGIFGHKPSAGIVSIKGHMPVCTDAHFDQYLSLGPMCRYAKDLPLLLEIMSGPNASRLRLNEPVNVDKVKLYYPQKLDLTVNAVPIAPEIREALRSALKYFQNKGSYTEPLNFRYFCDSMQIASTSLQTLKNVPNVFASSRPSLLWELAKVMLRQSEHTFATIFMYMLSASKATVSDQNRARYLRMAAELKQEFTDKLATDGVFLMPSFPKPALRHYESFGHVTGFMYTMIINALGFPATQVPLGFNRDGLPDYGSAVSACHRCILVMAFQSYSSSDQLLQRQRERLGYGGDGFGGTRKLSLFFATLCVVDLFGVFPIIALPKSIISCGLYGVPLVLFVITLQIYTAVVLGRCWTIAEKLDPSIVAKNRYPYAAIAEFTYGKRMSVFVTVLLDLTVFGGGIPNLLVAAQNLQLLGARISDGSLEVSFCYWLLIIGLFLCPIMWLGSPKNMRTLASVSVVVCSSVAILTWISIGEDRSDSVTPFKDITLGLPPFVQLLKAYGIIAFQFDIHPMLLTIQVDMQHKRHIGKAVLFGILTTCTLSAITTLLTAYRYGMDATSNVLQILPRSWSLYLTILLVTLQLCLSSAVGNSALFQHIEDVLGASRDFTIKRCIIRSTLVWLGVLIAEILPRFDLVMGIIGGTLTGPLIFILPPLFYQRMLELEKIYSQELKRSYSTESSQVSEDPLEDSDIETLGDTRRSWYGSIGSQASSLSMVKVRTTVKKWIELLGVRCKELCHFMYSDCILAGSVIVFGIAATLASTYYNMFDARETQRWFSCLSAWRR
uniref:Amidase domain-containing protein n=1 Tax=Anopheles epiroticus TaxID=199890 RepID=A0A182PA47_9DIPT